MIEYANAESMIELPNLNSAASSKVPDASLEQLLTRQNIMTNDGVRGVTGFRHLEMKACSFSVMPVDSASVNWMSLKRAQSNLGAQRLGVKNVCTDERTVISAGI